MASSVLCLVILAGFFSTVAYGELICASDADCSQDQCCVLEYGVRYGGTSCRPLGQLDATCHPKDSPLDTTVRNGPSSPEVAVRGVHRVLCPCRSGLRCSSGTCQHSLPHGSESHPSQVPHGSRLPPGSESHPAQVPHGQRLPPGSESHPAQVSRIPQ